MAGVQLKHRDNFTFTFIIINSKHIKLFCIDFLNYSAFKMWIKS